MTPKEVKRVTLEPIKFDNPHQECGQEKERLQELVKKAYLEGFRDGIYVVDGSGYEPERQWDFSHAKRELENLE